MIPVIAPFGVLAGHCTGDEVESDLDVEGADGVAPKPRSSSLPPPAHCPFTLAPTTTFQTQTTILTANVAVSGPAPATGTVQFFDGTTVLGTSPINAASVATLSASFLATGVHSLTATYSGDANYSGSSSTAPTSTSQIVTQAFNLNATPSPLLITRGKNGFVAVTMAAAGFSGTATLGCAGLPANAVCAFSQSTISGKQTVEFILKGPSGLIHGSEHDAPQWRHAVPHPSTCVLAARYRTQRFRSRSQAFSPSAADVAPGDLRARSRRNDGSHRLRRRKRRFGRTGNLQRPGDRHQRHHHQ